MSNYMNYGKIAVSGSWVYGISFDVNGNGTLTKIKKDGTEQKRLSDKFAENINVYSSWIYFVGSSFSDKSSTISKIRLSGEDEKTLTKIEDDQKYYGYLFVYNNKLYFSEIDATDYSSVMGKFYCMDLDGSNKKVVIDKAIFYPYIINDKIYYQDDSDYCRIHVCDLDGKNDSVFINEWVYKYIYNGEYFYYITYKDKSLTDEVIRNDKNFKLEEVIKYCDTTGRNDKVLIDSTNIQEFAMNKDTIFFTDKNDNHRLYSFNLSDGSIDLISNDANITSISILNRSLSYFDLDSNQEYIENIYYCALDGKNKTKIFNNEDE